MPQTTNWPEALKPLLKKYKGVPHPLHAKNAYQYMVLVLLSAQSNDNLINSIAADFFKAFPNLQSLSQATPESLYPYITKVRNYSNKAKWLTTIAATLKKDSNIPNTMEKLVELPGIGRKSANVILRETGAPPEGVIVDLHVLRVAPRLGVATGDDGTKMEKQLMEVFPREQWDIGMVLSFHGREICRPEPKCEICIVNKVCAFYKELKGGK